MAWRKPVFEQSTTRPCRSSIGANAMEWRRKSSPFPPPGNFTDYEAGKKRRYELFFAVNGGAFAVASWLWDDFKTVGALKSSRRSATALRVSHG